MSQYRSIRRTAQRQQLDRNTWAETVQLVVLRDVVGSGETQIEIPEFGTVFGEQPFFAYGVELWEGETLQECNYPFVSCGVYEWVTNEPELGKEVRYLGANVWVRIVCTCDHLYRLQLSFEGIAFKNVELI
jgi:hypothetical protein